MCIYFQVAPSLGVKNSSAVSTSQSASASASQTSVCIFCFFDMKIFLRSLLKIEMSLFQNILQGSCFYLVYFLCLDGPVRYFFV